jgi:hypothetical protein
MSLATFSCSFETVGAGTGLAAHGDANAVGSARLASKRRI